MIENDKLGGECLNYGCIPSKAMINTSDLYYNMNELAEQGIELNSSKINLITFQTWKNSVVKKLRGGIELLCKNYNVDIIFGRAEIKNMNLVEITQGDKKFEISTENIIIATGSRAKDLENLKFDHKQIVSAKDVLEFDKVPETMLVVGGGAIGLELGTSLAKLGTKVTVVEIEDKLLPGIEQDLVQVMEKSITSIGVRVMLNSKITNVNKSSLKVVVSINNNGEDIVEEFDKVLVSVGRQANIENLGLDENKIKVETNGFIRVDESLQTNIPGIYAIGDVTGPPWLAHKASMKGIKLAYQIAKIPTKIQIKNIPYAIYTEPEIASVGLTEEEANTNKLNVSVGKVQLAANARALTTNQTKGFAKVIVDKDTHKILGVHIVGNNASNLISEAILGLNIGMSVEDIESTIHPHPTLTEALFEAAQASLDRSVHTFRKKTS